MCKFLKENKITDGIEKRGKRKKDPPIPKKRFVSTRNKKDGLEQTNLYISTLKTIIK
ncbi:MAG: hypothetical protein U9N04_04965 [Patescibacteria group bacterium]|nr:hypothetical protein [Patescibacteria group bacterium]